MCAASVPAVGGKGVLAGRDSAALRSSGGGAAGSGELGVILDNMTPTNAIDGKSCNNNIHVLSFGLDKLVLNVFVDLLEELLLLSDMAKEDAQNSPIREDLSPLPPFLGHNLMMQPKGGKGVGGYEFLARSDDLIVKWKKPTRFRVPAMTVEFSSLLLWRLGGGGWSAVEAVSSWLRELFPGGCEVRVSYFHQCADLQGWVPELADLGGIVRRADDLDVWNSEGEKYEEEGINYRLAKGDKLGTVAAGRSNRLRMSIYDKTKEIKKSGKEWFRDVWAQHASYNPDLPVWRCEPQYGRELLHKYRVETLDDLRQHQDALFRYALAWFSWRERQVSDLAHPQRWPFIPAWAALWSARPESAALPPARVVEPKLVQLAQMADGCLSSFMAITDEADPAAALAHMQAIVRRRKGAAGCRRVLEKKRERYASIAPRGAWAGRGPLAAVAEVGRVRGEGLRPLRDRLRQWDGGAGVPR
jgi:hypothetical protein